LDAALIDALLQSIVGSLRAASPLEHLALLAGLGYALLAVRRDHRAWVFGAMSSGSLASLAAGAALPLQATLQSLYVVMAVYGFVRWSRESSNSGALRIRRWPVRAHALSVLVIMLLTLLVAPTLGRLTGAAWPYLDTLVTGLSLLATWLTARAVLENWLYWFAVNLLSMFLYGSQGLVFVSLLYAAYFAIAIAGWRSWRRALAGRNILESRIAP
jgi:nicotinamide mononucleotide transporter